MSFLNQNSKYVQWAIGGKTIKNLTTDTDSGVHSLHFTDGSYLQFYPKQTTAPKPCGCVTNQLVIIANAYHPNGDCIQTTEMPNQTTKNLPTAR